ncbi:BCL-6 corepressor-like protein 1 [Microcaecilia unicolor]|uniref:BCL-6 corepressor-like protein 1 n=1 Tax=Microcaecilia unicolor TaxID=1415580 RepID=A0A6P7YJ60_9AMPH|nr:BCL-6 corepressor-like protein 1 [Microcaecilia unicolor]XP_030064934.1 BCL-6 corepressor-like protein 1 [Microcaecilia unicolor]XP_030064935.1 BCL-6 corepressor-like protein 1 [Microcaecilia unicolor]XP_030064936.1 BCL-6 corepressor-like protein 1 [Microcaecilia unicolor]XP_030064937.1 BCL-6 corepressor-like protein 1 [Microcaecilia unicolor]
MISAAPLYSGVHNWTSGDCIRMCGINEDRRTPLSDEESKTGSSEHLGSQECCVSSGLSKVELTPVKNCADARMQDEDESVEERAGRRSDMTPPDPQTLEPTEKLVTPETNETAAPLTDRRDLRMLDSLLLGVPDPENSRTPTLVTEKPMEISPACLQCAETENSGKQKTALNAGLQVSGQALEGVHPVVSSSFSTLTSFSMSRVCYSTSQGPAVQKLPLSFQPGTVLTQSQPLVYIPPTSCRQPLSGTTLPTTLGVTPTFTLSVLPSYLQERCLSGIIAPQELRSYPYTSSVGRPLTSDHKMVSMEINRLAGTTPAHPPSCSNNVTSTVSNLSCADVSLVSGTKQMSSPHPALPVSCGSPVPLLSLNSYGRPPCHSDQHTDGAPGSFSPLKSPPQLEREMVSPQDCSEMPLDLSSKSKRQKLMPPNQRKTPPMPILTPVHTSGKAILSTVLSKSDCSSLRAIQNSYTSSSVTPGLHAPSPYVMFPELLRNGEQGSSQLLSTSGSWVKNSAALISTIPGTYVGVANPVPASLLLNKDANTGLSSNLQHLAKQEPISIVDQGELKNPGVCGKKGSQTNLEGPHTARRYLHGRIPSGTTVCSSKEFSLWNAHGHGAVYPKCPVNGKPSSPQVLPVAWPPCHQTSLLSIGASATGQLHVNQGTPPKVAVPVNKYSSCPNIHPPETSIPPQKSTAEKKLEGQQRMTRPQSLELDLPAKGQGCDPLLKSPKDSTSHPFLAPVSQGSALFHQTNTAEAGGQLGGNAKGRKEIPTANSTSEALTCDPCPRDTLIQADGPKTTCSQKSKPKNKVLGTYLSHDQQRHKKMQDLPRLSPIINRKDSESDVCGGKVFGSLRKNSGVNTFPCVQEVDLSKVKIEKDDYEDFACSASYSRAGWSPAEMPGAHTDMKIKVKTRIKKEGGSRCKSRCQEELLARGIQKKMKCKTKEADESSSRVGKGLCKRKWRKQQPESGKGFAVVRQKRRRRKAIKAEPEYFQQEEDYPEKKSKNSFQDFIPVVLTSRTRSQSGSVGSHFGGVSGLCDSSLHDVLPRLEQDDEKAVLSKRRRLRKGYRVSRYRERKAKDGPVFERRSHHLRGSRRTGASGKLWGIFEDEDEEEEGHVKRRKRRRQKNRKYQTGEYLTERAEEKEVAYCYQRRRAKADFRVRKRKQSPVGRALEIWARGRTSPQDSRRHSDFKNTFSRDCVEVSPGHTSSEKPSGKRKCKTKHLGGKPEEEAKGKAQRCGQSPRSRAPKSSSPRKSRDTWPLCKGKRNSVLSSPGSPTKHIPPEARRLIVNKNAGETLLQRAARLGYKDVVLYCLQRDLGDVNHRDNAGYTALHEACSRGWTDILQILLDHGANVNCSAQDGTRPIHDAVVNDNLETVWLLLSYGADPTLATYSGQTALKLASSEVMRGFLSDYLSDLRGRSEGDPRTSWDFYSSSIFEGKEEIGADIFLNPPESSDEAEEPSESDNFLFEFSDKPFLPCYNIQVSVSRWPTNWFLFSDVLKRLKISSRIFQARFPQFEIASLSKKEFYRQVSSSQLLSQPEGLELWPQEGGETVELVRYEPELLKLLGSDVEFHADSS